MNIYEYLDYRLFLQVWFTEQKQRKKQYSYRLVSRLLKQKSPSFLKDIIQNRRNLTNEQELKLIALLKLTPEEGNYFHDMVTFSLSSSLRIPSPSSMYNAERVESMLATF